MPKIIHAGDIHLDAPFSLFDVQKAQVRKAELRETFADLIALAKTEKADIMILSGDLFDSGFVTKETVSLIVSHFSSVPECRFVITPGNHDFISPKSPYKQALFPPNVYIFDQEQITGIAFPELGVNVYGYAFTSEEYTANPLETVPNLDKTKINILAAHADLGGKSRYAPIALNDLAASGFDYAALGHIHKGGEVKMAGKTYYAYSGCPEGRSFDECGIKGAIVAEITKPAGRLSASFEFRRLSKRRYERAVIDITGIASQEALLQRLRDEVSSEGYGSDVLLRVRLTGRISPETMLSPKNISAETLGLFDLTIEDASVPLLSYEELKNDISIRGAFFRELLPLLESENEEERRTAADALKYGLAALDGNDVIDF